MSEHGMTKRDELHPGSSIVAIRDEIQRLEDPRMRAVNEKQGNDFGINLTKLRAMAKTLKTNQELAEELWQSGESTMRLLALLICRPKPSARSSSMLGCARPGFPRCRTGC